MISHVQGEIGSGRSSRAVELLRDLPPGLTVVVDPFDAWVDDMSAAIGGEVMVICGQAARAPNLDSIIRVLASNHGRLRVLVDDSEQSGMGRRGWSSISAAVASTGGSMVIVTPELSSYPGRSTHLSTPVNGRHRALFA